MSFLDVESVLERVQCTRYSISTKQNTKGVMNQFLNEIKTQARVKEIDTKSLYFSQSYFIQQQLVDQIFVKLEQALKEIDLETISVSIYLNVTDYNRPRKGINKGPHDFSVTIKSQRELRYAINLLQIYKIYLKPYLDQNAALFLNHTQDFDRFFVFVGDINLFANGKTLHNTLSTFDMTIHAVEHYIDTNPDHTHTPNDFSPTMFFIPNHLARLSHFRKLQYFSYKQVSIKNLMFDLNYFNCYFKPIMDKFLKELV